MNKHLWRRGERIVFENGVVLGVMLFFSFMAWLLFWPHRSEIKVVDMRSAEVSRYEKVKASYSERVADLMSYNDYFYEQSLSILRQHKLNCLMADHAVIAGESQEVVSALAARRENLCDVFKEAADMVDTYVERLASANASSTTLLKFYHIEEDEEKEIGPFFTREECSEISSRLMQLGEQVTSCKPYEAWHYPLFFPEQ